MRGYGGPDIPTPALDFLGIVRGKEDTPGGTAAFSILEGEHRKTLEDILRTYETRGASTELERRARSFLFTYRELAKSTGVLDKKERKRLDQILDEPQQSQERHVARRSLSWLKVDPRVLVAAIVLLVLVVIGSVGAYVSSNQSGPPPGTAQQHPPAQVVPPGTTDLQQLKDNYGPWDQVTPSDQRPQSGSPALLLLENGGSFASTKWTVPPDVEGWQQDLTGSVDNVDVKGDHVDITDADGTPYIVGTNQPFIMSSNPGLMIRIDPTGNVLSITLASATAERQPLK